MQIRTSIGRRAMRTVAHITRFGTASGDRHSDLIADHIGGSVCAQGVGAQLRIVTSSP
jgi:hypothetical protein